MATVEDFKLRIQVEGDGKLKAVKQSVGDLKKDVEDFGQVGGPLGNTINGIVGKLGPLGMAASAAGVAFVALGSRALALAGELSDISGATGIAAGTLMNFRQSVVEAGGKADDFAQIASKLNQSIQEAASGNETFQKSFQRLGVFVTDANGNLRPTEEILRDVIARFQSGKISSDQLAASYDILGKNINKLDLTKLSAVADPIKDEQVKQIDKYNDAIDKLAETINKKLITAFGGLAAAINNALGAQDRFAKAEEDANKKGQTYRDRTEGFMNRPLFGQEAPPLSGQVVAIPERLRDMTEKEKAAYKARQEAAAAHASEMQRQLNRGATAAAGGAGGKGGFGATPEATLKAQAESTKRIAESTAQVQKEAQLKANSERLGILLQFADQQSAIEQKSAAARRDIEINRDAEIKKARADIFAQERLTQAQKEAEFAAKRKEITSKADSDIARNRLALTEAQLREEERITAIIQQSRARVVEEQATNDVISARYQFLNSNITASAQERLIAEKVFELEQERLKVIRQIALIKDLPPDELVRREAEINKIYADRIETTKTQEQRNYELARTFEAGWARSFKDYVENASNAAQTAERLFTKATQGMEDSFISFVKTGKFEFKGLVNMMLEELLRSQVRQLMAGLIGSGGGSGGLLGGRIIPGILAGGGPVSDRRPYIVGEQGPELFVPNTAGTMMPNRSIGGGTSVTYNINAVDAPSFKQMIASDPSFLYAVTQQGAKGVPTTRR